MMTLQELSDRTEIEQLSVRYANAIDRRDWDALDAVFTPDAYIDYRAMGGIDGRYAIRLAIGNLRTQRGDVERAWEILKREVLRGAAAGECAP